MKRLVVAIFPRDRDSIMSTFDEKLFRPLFFVCSDLIESAWARKYIESRDLVEYQLESPETDISDMSLITALEHSNLSEKMIENSVDYVYTDIANIRLEEWSQKTGIKLIVTPYELKKKYEDKIVFDKILKENNIPRPESAILRITEDMDQLPIEGKCVLQKTESSGSEGTFFVENFQEVRDLIEIGELTYGQDYLLRKFVEGGTYGITVFIAPGHVVMSSMRMQCFDNDIYPSRKIFIGVQWIPKHELSPKLLQNINSTFSNIGSFLHENEFFGFANFDFMVDAQENVYVIECNPRFSAATVQNLRFHDTNGGIDISKIFLENAVKNRVYPKNFNLATYPDTSFEGASLKINLYPELRGNAIEITNIFDVGLWNYDGSTFKYANPDTREFGSFTKQALLYSELKKGARFSKYSEICRIITNYRLYDREGNLNEDGKAVREFFKFDK